ncbi:MAG: putative ATP-binding protein involved in virulence [Flammeovirgaceae bacterium]|jgi:predicted ATP-binding protein involved in virulence
MRIEKLHIKNFRNIIEDEFYFHSNMTAAIGMNGRGKSSLLYALRVACGSYFLGIPYYEVENRHILDNEIRRATEGKSLIRKVPVEINATGKILNSADIEKTIEWSRKITKEKGKTSSSKEDVGQIKEEGKSKYEKITEQSQENIDLPVIAFFGTSRVHGTSRKREARIGRQIFKEGYHNWKEMRSATYQYPNFLASFHVLLKEGKEYEGNKEVFFKALKDSNPYLKEVEFIGDELWIKVNLEGSETDLLPLSMHSDGTVMYIEMVAELAYRCLVLNGHKKDRAIAEATGVVMIDEIDLHLHPNWQRHVLEDLSSTFKNIQFVVTTHSPIIVQSLPAKSIINLDSREISSSPNEMPLNKVATEIMGLKSIRSDDFNERYEKAVNKLDSLDKPLDDLTLDDYVNVSNQLATLLEDETDDPIYKAYLKAKNTKLEDETNK